MLTPVERVLVLSSIDLLMSVAPRSLVGLARAARELEVWKGQVLYDEDDPADALYVIVEGRIALTVQGRPLSEPGPGEAFGTWALVDDSARGQRAACLEDGLVLALGREDFYEVAAGDVSILQELLRALAKRLRSLVADRPEEARVEGEGVEPTTASVAATLALSGPADEEEEEPAPAGQDLAAAALGKAAPKEPTDEAAARSALENDQAS